MDCVVLLHDRTPQGRLARVLTLGLVLLFGLAQPAGADEYHIDSVAGDDATGDGSLSSPWESLSRLGTVSLVPGDHVLLKRGSVFRERLEIAASGAPANPIVIEAYDTAAAPVISAGSFIPQGAPWTGPDGAGEFSLTLGTSSDFYTSIAVLVRAQPSGIDSYLLLAKGTQGTLAEDSYALANVAGQRTIVYRPPASTHPGDFEFEVSKRNYAVYITGNWVTVRNIDGLLGNVGHPTLDPPLSDSTMISLGSNTVFENCRAAFGRSFGITVMGPDSTIDGCVGEHNHSSGLYILGTAAVSSTIKNSIARFNGNLEFADLDRGGIGVQADFAVIRDNVIHDNGNILDTTPPRIAGDDSISLSDCNNALIQNNFLYNSARSAIGMSWSANSFGHRIIGNVITNWNLVQGTGTLRTQAITLFGFGDTADSGVLTILNNTMYSDQVDTTLIGIQLGLPTNFDVMRDTTVLNNIVHMPDNVAADSFGFRLTREHLFDNVVMNYNDVYQPQTSNHYSDFSGTFSTAADFAAALGYEVNGLNVDPQFASPPVDPANPLSFDLDPASPLVDSAADVGLVSDFIGRSVPSGAAPDIGAFEPPSLCPDGDGDGVCDGDDVCAAGPLVVVGLLPPMGPLTPDPDPTIPPNHAHKQKRTLPLKLRLVCDETDLTDEDVDPPAIVALTRTGGAVDLPEIDSDAGESNDNGLLFRYSQPNWVYNLSTKDLETGSYVITIVTPEGLAYRAEFVLN